MQKNECDKQNLREVTLSLHYNHKYPKTKEPHESMQTATLNKCFIREYPSVYFEMNQLAIAIIREFSEEFNDVVHEILLEYVRVENQLCLNRHVHKCFQPSAFTIKVIASILIVDSTPTWHSNHVIMINHYTVTHANIDQLLSVNAWQMKCIIHISQFPVSWFYPPISRSRSSPGFTHCDAYRLRGQKQFQETRRAPAFGRRTWFKNCKVYYCILCCTVGNYGMFLG